MLGLERIADAFDHMHADVQRDFDNALLVDAGKWAGRTFGPDSIGTYVTAIPAGIAWSLGTFIMGSGKSLVDVLRLGEGVKSGTLKGVGQDTLRVLNLIPLVSSGAKLLGMGGRAASVMWAVRVAGQQGAMSCGPTAIAAASRLSGQSILMTLDEVGQATGTGIHPNAPNFPGMFVADVEKVLQTTSLANQEIDTTGAGIQAVEAAAQEGRGPVIFGAQWWRTVGGVTGPAARADGTLMNAAINAGTAPDHWMVAFRAANGEVMVADQFQVRTLASFLKSSQLAVASKAFLVEDGALLRSVSTLENVSSTLSSSSNAQWLASSFAINMVVVNAPTTWNLDAAVRDALGKPAREWPGMPQGTLPNASGSANSDVPAPQTIPVPSGLSATIQQDAMLVLGKLPRNGDTREFVQLVIETALSNNRTRDALLQLARSGLVVVSKWFSLDGKTTPGVIARALRQ
jgi:hypothetical protein